MSFFKSFIEKICVELELCEVKTCSKIDRKWGGDHLVPDSGLEKEEDNFRGGEPKTFLSSAKLLIVTVYKTLYVTYTCRLIAIFS